MYTLKSSRRQDVQSLQKEIARQHKALTLRVEKVSLQDERLGVKR